MKQLNSSGSDQRVREEIDSTFDDLNVTLLEEAAGSVQVDLHRRRSFHCGSVFDISET